MVFGLVSLIAFGESSLVFAAEKPIRFWNLTSATVTELRLAPAGSQNFGPDQCKNDKDGSVDHDERLPITGVTPGRTVVFDRGQGPHRLLDTLPLRRAADPKISL